MPVVKREQARGLQFAARVNQDGSWPPEYAALAVLQDIRDELRTLNELLACPRFLAIPTHLDAIRRNTRKPRRKLATSERKK